MRVLRARRILLIGALMLTMQHAHAQGCSQCRDNVAQSSPATQQAFRHSIYLLGGAALFFCGVAVAVARAFGSGAVGALTASRGSRAARDSDL